MSAEPAVRLTLSRVTLLAGTLDLLCAMSEEFVRGRSPWVVPKAIASGVLGSAAFAGGLIVDAFGVVLHFSMIWLMAVAAFECMRRCPAIARHRAISTVVYGVALWLLMRHVVVPLSAAPFTLREDPAAVAVAVFAHVVLVSLPIMVAAQQQPSLHGGVGRRPR